MLTFTEACTELRMSPKTLRKLITSGELEASRVGTHGRGGLGQYRIPESAVTDYLARRKVEPVRAAS
jgi:excisionase family DNA binding protein